jgi:uncharacterized protein YggL (DUF469 family)
MTAPCPSLGFTVVLRLHSDVSEAERDTLIDDLIGVLERHGLSAAGRGDHTMEFVVRRDGSQATDADRAIVRDWAARWTARVTADVGDLADLARAD